VRKFLAGQGRDGDRTRSGDFGVSMGSLGDDKRVEPPELFRGQYDHVIRHLESSPRPTGLSRTPSGSTSDPASETSDAAAATPNADDIEYADPAEGQRVTQRIPVFRRTLTAFEEFEAHMRWIEV
jgi:hypothetical protein